jgi:hypothetical protein
VTRAGRLVALALVLLAPTAARAKRRSAPAALVAERSAKSQDKPDADRAAPERSASSDSGDATTTTTATNATGGKIKTKTYTFGAMDVEGKLKTPQLLYFLNRVKLELDMSAPDTRSFMKELAKTADDKNL